MPSSTNHIMLVRPAKFRFNRQTATTNPHQQHLGGLTDEQVTAQAQQEFDHFAQTLQQAGIIVHVFNDTPEPAKPDAIFPNNWISFHPDGTVILYPMHTANRMAERRRDIVEALEKEFAVQRIIDLYQPGGPILEGTGSIVFDHAARTAYASRSQRTEETLFKQLCERLRYRPVFFEASEANGSPVYHTNVVMCIGEGFAVICLESIKDMAQRTLVAESLAAAGHVVIDISLAQMAGFAGNMLQVKNRRGENVLVMSQSAYNSLRPEQRQQLSAFAQLLPIAIPTIEAVGGGSARCMMAEVFLPEKKLTIDG
jgi:hypothetical protein